MATPSLYLTSFATALQQERAGGVSAISRWLHEERVLPTAFWMRSSDRRYDQVAFHASNSDGLSL
jgi:hypothetical protein